MRNARTRRGSAGLPLPRCDGAPASRLDRHDKLTEIKLKFLKAFARINQAYARLAALPKQARTPALRSKHRRALQAVERAILRREILDDRYAPRGIVAVPAYREGFTVDVRFTSPQAAASRRWTVLSSASSFLSIPLPPGLRRRS